MTGAGQSRLGFDVRRVDRSQEPVLSNLLELYCHDMAEWFQFDAHADASYRYPTEGLWGADAGVHLAYVDDVPVGFALVTPGEDHVRVPGVRDLHEFFVVRRHRGTGLGGRLAERVWSEYPGPWLVRVFHGNLPAMPFWRSVIRSYTGGHFVEEARRVRDRDWSYFLFESR